MGTFDIVLGVVSSLMINFSGAYMGFLFARPTILKKGHTGRCIGQHMFEIYLFSSFISMLTCVTISWFTGYYFRDDDAIPNIAHGILAQVGLGLAYKFDQYNHDFE